MGVKFVGIRKNKNGTLTHVLTNTGELWDIAQAQKMARRGEVDSLSDVHPDGTWEIKDSTGNDDFVKEYNLSILPEI